MFEQNLNSDHSNIWVYEKMPNIRYIIITIKQMIQLKQPWPTRWNQIQYLITSQFISLSVFLTFTNRPARNLFRLRLYQIRDQIL